MTSRVARIPLERPLAPVGLVAPKGRKRAKVSTPADLAWDELVDLGREAAIFANRMVTGWWATEYDWRPAETASAFVQFKQRLSGDVRVAVQGEAQGAWRRHRASVLRGDQRPPAFAADRSLCVRGRYAGGAGGVRLVLDAVQPRMTLRLFGVEHGAPHEFTVSAVALQKDRYLAGLWAKIAGGVWRCGKVTLGIDVRRRKLMALVHYERPVPTTRAGAATATLGPLEPDGSLLLRSAGATRDFSREIYEVRTKKAHYAGIVRRFRRTVGRGPRWRQVYRRHLPPSYAAWATARLHGVSKAMIAWCTQQGVDRLMLLPLGDGDWPAYELERQLKYKAEEVGIAVAREADLEAPSTVRAAAAPIRKAQRRAGQARKAVRDLRTMLHESGG